MRDGVREAVAHPGGLAGVEVAAQTAVVEPVVGGCFEAEEFEEGEVLVACKPAVDVVPAPAARRGQPPCRPLARAPGKTAETELGRYRVGLSPRPAGASSF